jgi:hypothetical protein
MRCPLLLANLSSPDAMRELSGLQNLTEDYGILSWLLWGATPVPSRKRGALLMVST